MPMVVYGAVMDLKKKGVSISLLGDAAVTDIKVSLRCIEYDDFMSRFYEEVTLSARGMCLAAAAKRTQEDLLQLSVAAVMELEMLEADSLAVLRMHLYEALPLPDPALLLVVRAGRRNRSCWRPERWRWALWGWVRRRLEWWRRRRRRSGRGPRCQLDGAPRGSYAGGGRGAGDEDRVDWWQLCERRLRGVADGGGAALGGVRRGQGKVHSLSGCYRRHPPGKVAG